MSVSFTPRQIVEKLDQYIIGQKDAKKAVAISLRNRYRRSLLDEKLQNEISPKNILMIGPTGVGKTEIARRLAKLVGAPFVKVEATKFTEVGYVGRDVESMVRDLIETSVRMVKDEKMTAVHSRAVERANERLIELLVPEKQKKSEFKNPLEFLFQGQQNHQAAQPSVNEEQQTLQRLRAEKFAALQSGELEDEMVTIEVEQQTGGLMDLLGANQNLEQFGLNMQDALGALMPKKIKKENVPLKKHGHY